MPEHSDRAVAVVALLMSSDFLAKRTLHGNRSDVAAPGPGSYLVLDISFKQAAILSQGRKGPSSGFICILSQTKAKLNPNLQVERSF